MQVDLIIHSAKELITMNCNNVPKAGIQMQELGLIANGAIAIYQGLVYDIGSTEEILAKYQAPEMIDATGKVVMPGFVDPHTHPIFVHTREDEFAMRLAGKNYVDIAKAGGGIRSTIKTTRSADDSLLFDLASQRISKMISLGTTTLEAKSGYGLNTASELKQLLVIKELNKALSIDIVPTFMGAHEFPLEYKDKHQEYIDILCNEMIPAVAEQGIAEFCDIFTEAHVYGIEESRAVLTAAAKHGMKLKMHADEIEPMGGAELAAEMGCISADHLGAASDAGILAMKEAGVIPVLLPATLFSLGSKSYARARSMIDHDLPVAIATDYNPGSCNCDSMALVMTFSCLQMRMSPEEALTAATINAAWAINRQDTVGSLEKGKYADLTLWDIPSYLFIPYHFGSSPIERVIKKGKVVFKLEQCK